MLTKHPQTDAIKVAFDIGKALAQSKAAVTTPISKLSPTKKTLGGLGAVAGGVGASLGIMDLVEQEGLVKALRELNLGDEIGKLVHDRNYLLEEGTKEYDNLLRNAQSLMNIKSLDNIESTVKDLKSPKYSLLRYEPYINKYLDAYKNSHLSKLPIPSIFENKAEYFSHPMTEHSARKAFADFRDAVPSEEIKKIINNNRFDHIFK